MSIAQRIRGFMNKAREERAAKIRSNAEHRAVILEKEARQAKELRVNLQRQQAAQKQINRTRELQNNLRKERFKKFAAPMQNLQAKAKEYKKTHKPIEFGLSKDFKL